MTSAPDEEAEAVARGLEPQHYLIRWLSEADTSLYGECEGRDFDAIHSAMLVEFVSRERPINGYSRVALTPLGHRVAAVLRGKP
jgi:hypothetical protein